MIPAASPHAGQQAEPGPRGILGVPGQLAVQGGVLQRGPPSALTGTLGHHQGMGQPEVSGPDPQPRWLRLAVSGYVALFVYGFLIHVGQIARGDYRGYPVPLAVFFTSLVVLDPLSAWALHRHGRAGAWMGAGVLAADAVANGYANYVLDPSTGVTTGRVATVLVAVLAVGLVLLGRRLPRPTSATTTGT